MTLFILISAHYDPPSYEPPSVEYGPPSVSYKPAPVYKPKPTYHG